MRILLGQGLGLLTLQVAYLVSFEADVLIVTRVLGPSQAAVFAVSSRAFNIVPLLAIAALYPLWPAYGEALSRGDSDWVARRFRDSLLLVGGLSLANAFLMTAFGGALIRLWSGSQVSPPFSLIVALGFWSFVSPLTHATSLLLNTKVPRFHLVCWVSMAVTNVGLSVLLTQTIGLPGAAWGTVISVAACILLPYLFLVPRFLAALERGRPGPRPAPCWRKGLAE